eukprot:GFYU01009992.1.p2 GENE.GFYU01009992.1~~GFYU01009992.1.p2  ORF type:complete len:213 (+),score=56.18 GFYU01009992.1:91-729(+)
MYSLARVCSRVAGGAHRGITASTTIPAIHNSMLLRTPVVDHALSTRIAACSPAMVHLYSTASRNPLAQPNKAKSRKGQEPPLEEILAETEEKGIYRFGFTKDDVQDLSEDAQKILSFKNAAKHEVNEYLMQKAVKEFQRHESDTGSPEVQIALLTTRIQYMTTHLKQHKKDVHSRKGLEMMVAQRRKLFRYLKKENVERYFEVAQKLGLRVS